MKRLQLVFIGIALLIGGGAYMLLKSRPVEAPPPLPAPAAPIMMLLAATRDLPAGSKIDDADIEWIKAPEGGDVEDRFISSSGASNSIKEQAISSYVRAPIAKGEPIRRSRLAKSSLMAMILSPGRRAVAIDVTPNTTAGGFILPNDRVDVLRTYRNTEATQDVGREIYSTELVLEDVRVLAIGSVSEKKGAEATVTGPTATLELTPYQAEIALMAQKSGQLSLALRPAEDTRKRNRSELDEQESGAIEGATIIRRGVVSTLRAR